MSVSRGGILDFLHIPCSIILSSAFRQSNFLACKNLSRYPLVQLGERCLHFVLEGDLVFLRDDHQGIELCVFFVAKHDPALEDPPEGHASRLKSHVVWGNPSLLPSEGKYRYASSLGAIAESSIS